MKKAQFALDYIIVLAILLLVAVVAIGLLGDFPDIGRAISVKHSQDFWKNQARPFTVDEALYDNTTGRLYIAMTSHADVPLRITRMYVNGTELSLYNFSASAAQGVGNSYCDSLSCKSTPCDCQMNMSPYETATFTTEYFAAEDEICGQQLPDAITDLQLAYTDTASPAQNFSEVGAFPFIIECKGSFNN